MQADSNSQFYGAIAWLLAGTALTIYGVYGLLGQSVYGVEELVIFIQQAQGGYILLAAFIAIFLEGLYFIGSFFPGSTMVVIIATISQLVSPLMFLLCITTIFIGWVLVGAVNIFLAAGYRKYFTGQTFIYEHDLKAAWWMTWFPSFRANYEVAQVSEGGRSSQSFYKFN